MYKSVPIKNTTFQHYNSSISRITFEKKDIIIIQYLNSFECLQENLWIPRNTFDI